MAKDCILECITMHSISHTKGNVPEGVSLCGGSAGASPYRVRFRLADDRVVEPPGEPRIGVFVPRN
jgi:hypothetical protein